MSGLTFVGVFFLGAAFFLGALFGLSSEAFTSASTALVSSTFVFCFFVSSIMGPS
jgi:hypothetical protein